MPKRTRSWLLKPRIFLIPLLLVPLAVCSSMASAPDWEIITAGPAWSGFTNRDGNGLYHDLMREIFPPPYRLKHEYVSSVQANALVAAGRADIMLCDTEVDPPRLLARYPLYENAYYLIYRRELVGPWRGVESLQGKRVAWREGYYSLRDFPVRVRPVRVRSGAAALMMMILGRAEFYVDDLALIKQSFAEASEGFDRGKYGLRKIGSRRYYPVFADTERGRRLKKVYEKGMERLAQDGRLAPYYRRWGFPQPGKTL